MNDRLESLAGALSRSSRLQGAEVSIRNGEVMVERGDLRVCLLEAAAIGSDPARPLQLVATDRAFLLLGRDAPPPATLAAGSAPWLLLPNDAGEDAIGVAVDSLLERLELRRNAAERIRQLSRYRYERGELVEIARAITQERDIDRLLHLILERSRYITGADAGSIYVLEPDPADVEGEGEGHPPRRRLRFKLSQNDSMSFESAEFVVPMSMESIAGAVVLTRQSINIDDVYVADKDPSLPYGFDESFDQRVGYRTMSMLTVPMISAEDEVIGVIQLINRKRDPSQKLETPDDVAREVLPFDARSEELLHALGAQAGIALENALLYAEIRNIFEGFVRASVQAIEQRDPTTSGHSLRVSVLSCALAETVDRLDRGPLADAHFNHRDLQELKYAALLHDFGKIGVREQVLVKAKKLYPHEREAIRTRIDYALATSELELARGKIALMERGAGKSDLERLQDGHDARRARLQEAWELIDRANEPSVLSEGDFSRIAEVGALEFLDIDGRTRSLLSSAEVAALQITRGSLSPAEFEEIRSHVRHTYDFLTRIPWGKSMARIPEIAGAHHEKLNGTGYPRGVGAKQIPLASKIMTIADIYDALTARDRPYKKALPSDRALDILALEVKDGHLDGELVKLFEEARIYRMAEGELSY